MKRLSLLILLLAVPGWALRTNLGVQSNIDTIFVQKDSGDVDVVFSVGTTTRSGTSATVFSVTWTAGSIFNDAGRAGADFRIESDTEDSAFVVDAGGDSVKIGVTLNARGALHLSALRDTVTAIIGDSGSTVDSAGINAITSTTQTLFSDGDSAHPAITNLGDLNTGIYFPTADQVAVTNGGVRTLLVSGDDITVRDDINVGDDLNLTGTGAVISLDDGDVTITHSAGAATLAGGQFNVNDTLTVGAGGKLIVGRNSYLGGGVGTNTQILGTSLAAGSINLGVWSTTAAIGPAIAFSRAYSNTIGAFTVPADGTILAFIPVFAGDGTDLSSYAGALRFEMDGTGGDDDSPGRFSIWTTPDGSKTTLERVRVASTGNTTIDVDGTMSAGTADLTIQNGTNCSSVDASATSFTNCSSNRNWKTDIGEVDTDSVLAALRFVRPYTYRLKGDFVRSRNANPDTMTDVVLRARTRTKIHEDSTQVKKGFMAQDIARLSRALNPSVASDTTGYSLDPIVQGQQVAILELLERTDDASFGGVSIGQVVAGLVAAVAGLTAWITTLKKQINALEERIAKLEGVAPTPPNPEA